MRQQRKTFRLTPIAACFLATGTVMGMAHAGTIDSVNLDNIQTESGVTAEVYQNPPTNDDTNGFIDFESTIYPGIEVYQESFRSGGTDFVGCIMSKLDRTVDIDGTPTAENCKAPSDAGKRIKLNATAASDASAPLPEDGVDLVFVTADDVDANLYRWFGKLGNQSDGRLTGFKLEVGTGVGSSFTTPNTGDGLSVDVTSSPFGNFPGGLFGGSPVNPEPFFSADDADFTQTAAAEDSIEATEVPAAYAATFGNWLPLKWVPLAWFFDDDGNPATDDVIQAWFDGEKWIDGNGDLIAVSDLETWETTPPTVVEDDGTLYATWNYDNEVYDLAAGGTLTLEEMNDGTADPTVGIPGNQRDRVPGYSINAVEDLAKINVNFQIAVGSYTEGTVTVRLTPIVSDDASAQPTWVDPATDAPFDPITSDEQPGTDDSTTPDDGTTIGGGGGGGCTIGGNRPFDPLLPGLALAALAFLGLRRRWKMPL